MARVCCRLASLTRWTTHFCTTLSLTSVRMMLRAFLVAAVVAVALGDELHSFDEDHTLCCSAEDRREIQFLWKHVWVSASTDRRVTISRAIFQNVFERYPEARDLFTRVNIADENSPEYRAHLVRVANGLDTIINLMNHPDVLYKQIEHLTNQHVARTGVKGAYFLGMIDAFDHIMPQIAPCFNLEAWHRCFGKAAHMIASKLP